MGSGHDVEYLGRDLCGADVVSARFSRPPGFDFVAGQWIVLTLSVGEQQLAETFTICSAPSDDYLEITTRLSGSAFKNALEGLAPGDHASVTGPGGRLRLPPDSGRVAFLVGGVGITPARSMLRDACAAGRVFDDALLFYGNRDASCVPFEAEFAAMATERRPHGAVLRAAAGGVDRREGIHHGRHGPPTPWAPWTTAGRSSLRDRRRWSRRWNGSSTNSR